MPDITNRRFLKGSKELGEFIGITDKRTHAEMREKEGLPFLYRKGIYLYETTKVIRFMNSAYQPKGLNVSIKMGPQQ